MSQVVGLVPARSGSKGIPHKNFRKLGGKTLIQHAVDCAKAAGITHVCVSTDDQSVCADDFGCDVLWRDHVLAADDTPMFAVAQDFVARMGSLYTATNPAWTGKPVQQTQGEQIICLLQPTAPFRTPAHIQSAIRLLRETRADSVVSVVELPRTHHADLQTYVADERLYPHCDDWRLMPTRRQNVEPAYIRDGTVYAFWVKTLKSGTLYGRDVRPLIIPPEESCELDTEADWADVERRWRDRAKQL
jgi:CMP-N,N'-diacetyllegionaminic acid synthase